MRTNWRPWTVTAVLLIGAVAWLATENAERAAQIEPRTEREMAIRNSARLDNLEHDVRELEKWRDDHTKADAAAYARLGQVEVVATTHEKYIGVALAALFASFGALVMSFLTRRAQTNLHLATNSRFDELLAASGRVEHEAGRIQGRKEERNGEL